MFSVLQVSVVHPGRRDLWEHETSNAYHAHYMQAKKAASEITNFVVSVAMAIILVVFISCHAQRL